MTQTIPDISIGNDQYYSINQLASVPVGTALEVQLKSNYYVHLIESSTQPTPTSTEGKLLLPPPSIYSVVTITSGSLEIWARSSIGLNADISITVIS